MKPSFNVDSPVQPAVLLLHSGPAQETHQKTGVGNDSLKWKPIASSCFVKIIAQVVLLWSQNIKCILILR